MIAHDQVADLVRAAAADPWRSRVISGSAHATALLYRWRRRSRLEPTVLLPIARERAAAAIAAVGRALIEDRRMTREAWRLYARRLNAGGRGERRAFVTLALGVAGARRLPLIAGGSRLVLPLLTTAGVVADLIGWETARPDEWVTRTAAFSVLVGRGFNAEAERLRLCRHPASWHAAGGEASAAVCLLDATDTQWCLAIERAASLVCDDDDHAAAVLEWIKARRPKLPKLFVAGGAV